jgi:energy-coupling factor transporter ATP-binding protein EcfA2
MKLVEFWAKGYRSLADVHLKDLGAFNVFYGPNGAGKSNILAAMRTFFRTIEHEPDGRTTRFDAYVQPGRPSSRPQLLQPADFAPGEYDRSIQLGGIIATATGRHSAAFTYSLAEPASDVKAIQVPAIDGAFRRAYAIPTPAFQLVDAHRVTGEERMNAGTTARFLSEGKLKSALFQAQNDPDVRVRERLDKLRTLLGAEPYNRHRIEPVWDELNVVDLRERLPGPPSHDVSIDVLGLGVTQLYFMLAQILLPAAPLVAVEEPEAHLHGPTTGRQLRNTLRELVQDGSVSQLFIATHSNLFDLDDTGYFDVAMHDGATTVTRRTLEELDARHLYEPGPAMQAIRGMLRYVEPTAVVFRRANGDAVTAREMLGMLQSDDPVAFEFLQDVHSTAVDLLHDVASEPAAQ